ncbi:uncharacterized protein [Haliotis asinina]|uniref:uncharacterized protein n=1 Tax=Haliotis asinina TaxID=109174 RepID=UPI003531D3DE
MISASSQPSQTLTVEMFLSKTQLNTPFIHGAFLLNLVTLWPYCLGELLCPTITELHSPVKLTCIQAAQTGAHSYSTPTGTTAASCDLPGNKCIPLGNFTAMVVNKSSSVLAIPRLLQTHAGAWACVVDADAPSLDTCHITVEKTPTCRIMSQQNTSTMRVGQELSLTIILTGYYCSEIAHVQVKTGGITSTLLNGTVTALTDSTENITLNITTSHIGEVGLVFSCDSYSQMMSCDGIQELVQSLPGISATETYVTNTTITEKESTNDEYLTPISVVMVVIAVTVFIAIAVILVRRRFHNHSTQRAKDYDYEADPSVPNESQEYESGNTWYTDAPLASEEDTRSETL